MQGKSHRKLLLNICVAAAFFCLCALNGYGQEGGRLAPSSSPPPESASDARALSELIRDLQTEVQALNSQLTELRAAQQSAKEEVTRASARIGYCESEGGSTRECAGDFSRGRQRE